MARLWTINGRFLTQNLTGVQRYAHEIVRALDDLIIEGHSLARGISAEIILPRCTSSVPSFKAIRVRQVGRFRGHLWEQIELPYFACGSILSLCNTSTVVLQRQIVCVHDVNTVNFPSSYTFGFRSLYRLMTPILGRVAAAVTTVSQYSATELVKRNWVNANKMSVIPNGHEHALRWSSCLSQKISSATGPDVVVVLGSPAPHKNIGMLIDLAERLSILGIRLAIVGKLDHKVFNSHHATDSKARNVVWLGSLSDDELAALLTNCLCLAFPSFGEGFGLPPLEAMSLGCPVVVSNRSSLPEVCGDAAFYASPEQPQEWESAFACLFNNRQLRSTLIDKGLTRSKLFSWRRSALQYLELMAKIDGQS